MSFKGSTIKNNIAFFDFSNTGYPFPISSHSSFFGGFILLSHSLELLIFQHLLDHQGRQGHIFWWCPFWKHTHHSRLHFYLANLFRGSQEFLWNHCYSKLFKNTNNNPRNDNLASRVYIKKRRYAALKLWQRIFRCLRLHYEGSNCVFREKSFHELTSHWTE